MLDFFSSKKAEKHHHHHHHHEPEHHHHDAEHHHRHHKLEEERSHSPLLSPNDEEFLERIVSKDDGSPPPLHMPGEPQLQTDNPLGYEGYPVKEAQGDTTLLADRDLDEEDTKKKSKKHEGYDNHSEKSNTWSLMQRFKPKKEATVHAHEHDKGDGTITPKEAAREEDDLSVVLEKLNLSTSHNRHHRGLSLSKDSRELVQQFNLILKDIVNGVPTAYDDLVQLLDSSNSHLEKSYGRLPPYLQKTVKKLPKKFSKSLAPSIIATAAEAQGASKAEAGGMATAAKKTGMRMPALKDLVTKPGAMATLLRSVMNFLKLRFPAFMGTSALWSLGVFTLLLALWYCHKRGREVRLAKEKLAAGEIRDEDRFEELDDDDSSDGTFSPASGTHSGSRKRAGHHSGRLIEK